MGGVVASIIAALGTAGIAIAEAAETAGLLATSIVTTFVSGDAITGTGVILASGVANNTVLTLTNLGLGVFAATSAIYAVGIGYALNALTKPTSPNTTSDLISIVEGDLIDSLPPSLVCIIDGDKMCGKSTKRKMRVQRGESRKQAVLSDESESWSDGGSQENVRQMGSTTARRKIPRKAKRLRRTYRE